MKQIYAIRDKKGEDFFNIFLAKNSAVAVRMLKDFVQNPNFGLYRTPEDYCLYWLGSINEENGLLIPLKQTEKVAEAEDYKIEQK